MTGTVSILIVIVSVIATEAAFESMNHMTAETPFAELVVAIENELMIVGSMAFLFKIIINLTSFINSEWLLALEYADLLVPVITFSRCFIGIGLIYMSIKGENFPSYPPLLSESFPNPLHSPSLPPLFYINVHSVCDSWGKAYHFHHLEVMDAYLDKHHAWFTRGKLFFILPLSSINSQMEFRIFHAIFCEHYMIQRSAFAFDEYVHRVFEKLLLRIISMHEIDWFIICIMALLNWARVEFKLDVNECLRAAGKPDLACLKQSNMVSFCYFGVAMLALNIVLAVVSRYYELEILTSRGVHSSDDFALFLDQADKEAGAQKVSDKKRFNADDLKAAVIRARNLYVEEMEAKEHSLLHILLRCPGNLYALVRGLCFKKDATAPSKNSRGGGGGTVLVTSFDEEDVDESASRRYVPSPKNPATSLAKGSSASSVLPTLLATTSSTPMAKNELQSHMITRRASHANLETQDVMTKIFFLGRSYLYFDTVCLSIMPISFYLALWITNFVSLASEIDNTLMWQFLSLLPGILSMIFYMYTTRVASLLLAMTELDNDAVEEILEQTEGARQLQAEMREKILSKLEEIGNPREELKNLFESIDDNDSGLLSRSEFQTFLNQLQITFSKKKWSQIYAEIDKDGSNEIDYHELFLFIFPDSNEAKRMEGKRIRDIKRRVGEKAKNLIERNQNVGMAASRKGSTKSHVILSQIVDSTKHHGVTDEFSGRIPISRSHSPDQANSYGTTVVPSSTLGRLPSPQGSSGGSPSLTRGTDLEDVEECSGRSLEGWNHA